MEKIEIEQSDNPNIVKNVLFSIFEYDGPTPIISYPSTLSLKHNLQISIKSISLLMGEEIYQEGRDEKEISYFGILPFPDIEMVSLTNFFLIPDENARGKAKAATLNLMIPAKNMNFVYENMKQLSIIIVDTAELLRNVKHEEKKQYKRICTEFYERLQSYEFNISDDAWDKETRKIKVLFTGLDNGGKTSFLKTVKKKYSEIMNVKPTRGINRTEISMFGQTFIEWDAGGQLKYRENLIKEANIYLFDINILFFLIDIQDSARLQENMEFFSDIISKLKKFHQSLPIIICFHKMDNQGYEKEIQAYKEEISKIHLSNSIQFYNTSIFNTSSVLLAYSAGIKSISINQEILMKQIETLGQQTNAHSIILLDEQDLILGEYINQIEKTENCKILIEYSAIHYKELFRIFSNNRILKNNRAEWITENRKIHIYNKIIGKKTIYILITHLFKEEEIHEKINKLMETFLEKIVPLIKNYL